MPRSRVPGGVTSIPTTYQVGVDLQKSMGQSCVFLKIQIAKDSHIYHIYIYLIIYPFWFPRKWLWKKPTGCFWAHFGTHPFTNPKPNPWVFGRSQPQRVPSNPGEICSALSLATLVVGGHPDGNRGAKKWSIKLSELIRILHTYSQHTYMGHGQYLVCSSKWSIFEECTTSIVFQVWGI